MPAADRRPGLDADAGLVACLGAFLLGFVTATLWIAAIDGPLQLAGIAAIIAGIAVCFLEMGERRAVSDLLEERSLE